MNHLPEIRTEDGESIPLEPDRIIQTLFDATRDLGKPSAFLARELAEGVFHFLTPENVPEPPTLGQLAELVAKVVRELGHPDLARCYLARMGSGSEPPREAAKERADPGDGIFTRDLLSAARNGFLVLPPTASPPKLACLAARGPYHHESPSLLAWQEALFEQARTARHLRLDVAEESVLPGEAELADWFRAVDLILRATDVQTTLVLGNRERSEGRGGGDSPLFGQQSGAGTTVGRMADSWTILRAWNGLPAGSTRWSCEWVQPCPPLPGRDVWNDRQGTMLGEIACTHPMFRFRLQRAGKPSATPDDAACLETIVLPLPGLAWWPEVERDVDAFLEKLPGLAGMAVSAGSQYRAHLRRRAGTESPLTRGFLLDRSILQVQVVGLEAAVADILGARPEQSGASLDLAVAVLQRLRDALETQARRAGLEARLEVDLGAADDAPFPPNAPETQRRLETAAVLHPAAGRGTLVLSLSRPATGEEWHHILRAAGSRQGVDALRLVAAT